MRSPDWLKTDVSRETLQKLFKYADLILKWTKKINLVSTKSQKELFERHIWDGAQVYQPRPDIWADLGSGGGLPGVVVAILAQNDGAHTTHTLVESDQRKAAFLRTCARELEVPMTVRASRIERLDPLRARTISARALAPLDTLFELAAPHLDSNGICLFQKGENWKVEVNKASQNWRFSYEATASKTNTKAVILRIKDLERV